MTEDCDQHPLPVCVLPLPVLVSFSLNVKVSLSKTSKPKLFVFVASDWMMNTLTVTWLVRERMKLLFFFFFFCCISDRGGAHGLCCLWWSICGSFPVWLWDLDYWNTPQTSPNSYKRLNLVISSWLAHETCAVCGGRLSLSLLLHDCIWLLIWLLIWMLICPLICPLICHTVRKCNLRCTWYATLQSDH